jgi:hypothetical protein
MEKSSLTNRGNDLAITSTTSLFHPVALYPHSQQFANAFGAGYNLSQACTMQFCMLNGSANPMKLRFTIRDLLWLTLVVAMLATICRAVPVVELRHLGLPMKSLYLRDPSLTEFAIRLTWSAPLVLGCIVMSVRHRNLTQ